MSQNPFSSFGLNGTRTGVTSISDNTLQGVNFL